MSQRPNTDGTLGVTLDGPTLTLVYILRLDVEGDPLFAWTGFGDLTFAAGETGDAALDGQTFAGITHLVVQIGAVEDAQGGSSGLEIVLPGADLLDEAMRQVVYDRRKWQFRSGRVWLAFLDEDEQIIGKPVRIKSGRMDKMTVEENDDGTGTITCILEGQQAYASEAIATRYSEQAEVDASDNSQRYVWALANMTPAMGQRNAIPGTSGGFDFSGGPLSIWKRIQSK